MKRETYDKARWLPIIITGVILLVIYYAINNFAEIAAMITKLIGALSPLLIGITITYFIYLPHRKVENLLLRIKWKRLSFITKRARGISTIIIFIFLLAIIALVLAYVLPILFSSIADLASNIPGYVQSFVLFVDDLVKDTPFASLNLTQLLNDNSNVIVNTILSSTGFEQAARGVINFTSGVFNFIIGLFLALYLLLYRDEIREYFSRLNKSVFKNERRQKNVARYIGQINNVLLTYIASKSVDCLTNFAAATLIVTLSGMPYALLLGLMAGLLNFIPYIGSIISATIISILALLTVNLPTAIVVAICMFAFQQLDGNFIEPRIMKTSLKLNPILVIMAVIIFGDYFGLPGMFLGVPVAAIIKQLIEEYMSTSESAILLDDSRR